MSNNDNLVSNRKGKHKNKIAMGQAWSVEK